MGKAWARIPGSWLFLAVSVALFLGVTALAPQLGLPAARMFLRMLLRLLPVMGLVFVVMLLFNLLAGPGFVRRHLGSGAGARGWSMAVAGGVLSLGPIYPWFALLRDLRAQGMRPAFAAAFLYTRAVKPALLPLLVFYFGLAYTVVLCAWLLLFAVVSGWTLERLLPREEGAA